MPGKFRPLRVDKVTWHLRKISGHLESAESYSNKALEKYSDLHAAAKKLGHKLEAESLTAVLRDANGALQRADKWTDLARKRYDVLMKDPRLKSDRYMAESSILKAATRLLETEQSVDRIKAIRDAMMHQNVTLGLQKIESNLNNAEAQAKKAFYAAKAESMSTGEFNRADETLHRANKWIELANRRYAAIMKNPLLIDEMRRTEFRISETAARMRDLKDRIQGIRNTLIHKEINAK
jgi:hypothetical protein